MCFWTRKCHVEVESVLGKRQMQVAHCVKEVASPKGLGSIPFRFSRHFRAGI